MKMPFSRKPAAAALPPGVTEVWAAEENSVVVHLPFDSSSPDASLVADTLSDAIVAVVRAVQAGDFGHSIPEGTSGAGVQIQVDATTPLGPLAKRNVEILQERLGRSIPLSVVEQPLPVVVEEEPAKAAPKAVTAPVAPVVRGPEPSEGLVPAVFVWDEENERLRTEIVLLGETGADAQTQVDLRRLVELTIASLASPSVRETVPADAPSDYAVWVTVVVNEDAAGPLTEKMFTDGEEQFEDTRVDFVAMTEPRETVEEMIAGR